jgi:hypothetical protein
MSDMHIRQCGENANPEKRALSHKLPFSGSAIVPQGRLARRYGYIALPRLSWDGQAPSITRRSTGWLNGQAKKSSLTLHRAH